MGQGEGRWSRLTQAVRDLLPTILVASLGAGFSISAYALVLDLYRTEALKAFEGPANQFATAISKTLDGDLEVVQAAGAYFSASNEVDRWEFFQFARDALPRHPAIQAIEWVPQVPGAQRPLFEEQARADGLFGFRFVETDAAGQPVEAGTREVHYPVYFVEPFLGNEAALGRDLAASEVELAALLRSRDSGQVLVAPPQTSGLSWDQPELIVLQPVYGSNAVPDTRAERREQLLGFVRGVIRLGHIVQAVQPRLSVPGGLDVHIFERADSDHRQIYGPPASQGGAGGAAMPFEELIAGLHVVKEAPVAGEHWSIVIVPNRGWRSEAVQIHAWSILVVGLLLTALLLQYLLTSRTRTRAIEHAVTLRTAELRQSNLALEQEIGERKRAEEQLRTAKEKAEVASRAKSEFLAMMGHELRTPLNAVIGFSEILSNEALGPLGDERYCDYAGDINRSGAKLLAIINDILDLTKMESDEFEIDEDRLDLSRLLTEICEPARAKADEAALDFTLTVASDTPCLMASRQAVKRILANLLANAIKFTPAGGQVTVDCRPDPSGGVAIEVADTGIGIAPEQQKRIFQPFTQADQSLSRQHEGTGLGLTLARRLVEIHGAAVALESRIGEGTRVRVTFPPERSRPSGKSSDAA